MKEFHQHQKDAVKQAYDLLKEHFDSCLITVTTANTDEAECSQVFWAGGYAMAVGNSSITTHKLLSTRDLRDNEPTE